MKRVLITGANSYVGTNVEKWLMKEPDKYYVETLDMKDPNWKEFDFSGFDVVFHVAGIAHVSTKKSMKNLYFKVNRDLAIETAVKAKESGVNQFIFMSSMIVYNSKETKITKDIKPNPDNFYGLSKLQAENELSKMHSQDFKVCIIRPPMIYGEDSKGNFPKLIKLSKKTLFFPKIENKRSIIYILNLANFVKLSIKYELNGVHHIQNTDYFTTYLFIEEIRKYKGKNTILVKLFNPLIYIFIKISKNFNRLFSSYYYDKSITTNEFVYEAYNYKETISYIEGMLNYE